MTWRWKKRSVMSWQVNRAYFSKRPLSWIGNGRVNAPADLAQDALQVAGSRLEGVGIDGQRRAQHDQRRAVARTGDGLLDAQPPDRLHGHGDRAHDLRQLVQRTGHPVALLRLDFRIA